MVSISNVDSMLEMDTEQQDHALYDNWVLWAHLPHDTDWSIGSYKSIMVINTLEQMVTLYSILPDKRNQ